MGDSCLIQASDRIDFGYIGKEQAGLMGYDPFSRLLATAKTDSSVAPQSPDASVVPGLRDYISGDVDRCDSAANDPV